MFKKALPILIVVALAALALPLVAFAQNGTPPSNAPELDQGFYGPGRRGGRMGGGWMGGGVSLVEATAEVTGMTVDEVVAALQGGETYADVAERANVELQDIVDEVVAQRTEALNEAVDEGWFTQEQANWMLEEMSEHLMARLEGEWEPRGGSEGGGYRDDREGGRPYGGMGRRGGRGRGPAGQPRGGYGSGCPYAQPQGPEA